MEKLTVRPRNREKEPFYGWEAAEAVADRLEGLGYLDDGQYAHAVAEHCAAKGYGPGRIREELYRRGVPRDCWDGALEGLSGLEEAIDAFCRGSYGGRSSPTQRCAGGQPTFWPAGVTVGRTSVPACAAMVRSRRNGRKNAADCRM